MRQRLKCNSKMAANCVPLTIVLVSLFTLAIAASSSSLPTRSGDQLRVVKPIVRLPSQNINWLDNEARVLEALGFSSGQRQLNQDNQQLKQAISSISSEPLAIRQQQQQPQIDEADNDNNNNDDDDEQFLRQLLIAGDYLKDKLAVRENDVDLQLANESPRYALELPSKFYLAPEYPHRDPSGANDDNPNSELDLSNDNNNANAKNNLLKYLLLLDKAQVAQDDQQAHAEKRTAVEQDNLNGDDVDRDEQVSLKERAPIKYTTLLEDEQADNHNSTTIASPTTSSPAVTTSTVSYGQVVVKNSGEDGHKLELSETGSSTFARMYNKLAHYLPFLGQMDILRGRESANVTQEAAISSSQSGDKKVETATGRQVVTQSNDNEVNKQAREDKHEEQPAKQRVSMTLNKKNSHYGGQSKVEQHKDDQDDNNQKRVVQVNRKSEDSDEFLGQFKDEEEEKEGQKQVEVSANSKRLSISLTPGEEFELSQMIGPVVKQEDSKQTGVNLIRQSSLLLPLSSASLKSSGIGDDENESLLGKYIYAPTQHYYLSAPPPAHHSGQGSAAYAAYQKAPTDWTSFGSHSLGGAPSAAVAMQTGKPTNDLYFLVMVGAFCMMAMAIVLAAGAFAYRVQQQRKSSQEPDYPTYGVVGPNNMASKCNAFGYFNNQHTGNPPAYGGGGATGSSKSPSCGSAGTTGAGSAKHLAELYAAAAAAGVGGDSGLASSLDKCSSGSSGSVGSKKQLPLASASTTTAQSTNGSSSAGAAGAAASGNQDAARMYHYQHQKQQMILSSGASFGQAGKRHTSASDLDSEDEDNDDGSYTVYECPGLASAHEMEIKNPLFNDDHSP